MAFKQYDHKPSFLEIEWSNIIGKSRTQKFFSDVDSHIDWGAVESIVTSKHQFIDRSSHPYAIRLYAGPLEKIHTKTPAGKPYTLLNLPYFLAGKIYKYIEWLIPSGT